MIDPGKVYESPTGGTKLSKRYLTSLDKIKNSLISSHICHSVSTLSPMKKLLIFGLSTVLLLSVQTVNAAAKAGTACPKAGKTSTVNDRIYTCIKLGSKLYWNNGKLVKSTPAKNKSSSQPSGTVSQQNASKKAASI